MTRPLILGHRGYSARYPENTRLALVKAMEAGADGIELDVDLSCDDVVMVMHDETVDRTTDGHGPLHDLSYAALRKLNAAKGWTSAWEPIPTLQEVLDDLYQVHPHGLYNIEIKVSDGRWREVVDQTLRVCRDHPLRQHIRYSSFHQPSLEYLLSQEARAQAGLLLANLPQDLGPLLANKGWIAVHLWQGAVDSAVVSRCHEQGLEVAVYTVDDEETMRRMVQAGVDVMISNQVGRALDFIASLSRSD